jgi:hypothetical protein
MITKKNKKGIRLVSKSDRLKYSIFPSLANRLTIQDAFSYDSNEKTLLANPAKKRNTIPNFKNMRTIALFGLFIDILPDSIDQKRIILSQIFFQHTSVQEKLWKILF